MKKLLVLVCVSWTINLSGSALGVVTNATWLGGDGNWNNNAKWSSGAAPNNSGGNNWAVKIDDGNAASSTVTQTTASITVTIDKLVLDADDRLRLNNGVNLIVTNGPGGGVVTNRGTITLNATSSSGVTLQVSGGTITLAGGGTIALSNHQNNMISGGTSTDVLINEDNTIQGAGQIGDNSMGLDNRGTISANQPTALVINPSSMTVVINSGILQSTNGALLRLYDGVFTNTLGTIRALTTSTVEVDQASIVGGLLTSEGSGAIRAAVGTSGTLASIHNTGQLLLPNGANFVLIGTITNEGTFQLESSGSGSDLIVGGTVTLTGGGTITFGNHVNNRLYGDAATDSLINEDNTIQGAGQIGLNNLGVDNRGTIIANQPTQLLIDPADATGFINRGTLQADAACTLYVTGSGFSNFVAATSTLTGGAYRVAGTFKFTDANIVNNSAALILDGAGSVIVNQFAANALANFATNTALGSFTIQNGRNLSLSNSFVNYGSLNVATADSTLSVGSNRYTQAAGSTAVNSSFIIGDFGCTVTGLVEVTGGNLFVTNATMNALLEVRSGTLTLSAGGLTVDKLVITNACARFIHTGGALVTNGVALIDPDMDADGDGLANSFEQSYGLDPFDPRDAVQDDDGDGQPNIKEILAGTDPQNATSVFRITGLTREGNNLRVIWTMGAGKTNALQRSSDVAGGYGDIFTVTNSVGAVTNYLDVGAVTNWTSSFYRVRLVP